MTQGFSLVVFWIFLILNFQGRILIIQGREDGWLTMLVKSLPVIQRDMGWRQKQMCQCGIGPQRNQSERIVGGVLSKRHAWPWMGAIVFLGDKNPKLVCGSSVINKRYLLTAAHCAEYLQQLGMDRFRVLLGTNDMDDREAVVPEVESILLHPRYNQSTKEYDAALIKLKHPLKYSPTVAPICITPQTGVPYHGKEAIVVGWGTTMFGGAPATMQMETMVNVTSNKICSDSYQRSDEGVNITEAMLCASAPGTDSCQGDSGGPLFLQRQGTVLPTFHQIGIVSFGSGCADSRYPGVYTRLGKILNWIKSSTRDSTYCKMP